MAMNLERWLHIEVPIMLLIICYVSNLCSGAEWSTWMDVTFRVNKLNFIWSKATHHLTDKNLIKRLKIELDKFDAIFLSAKSAVMKSEKFVLDEVDGKLKQLLEKYGLESAISAYDKKYKWRNEEEIQKESVVLPSVKFGHPKLQKLWHIALNSRISEAALKTLYKELEVLERKLESYEKKVLLFNERTENALDEDALQNNDKLNRELKEHHISIVDSYDSLHQKIIGLSQRAFNNEKVEKLWRSALGNSNISASELESIRVELSHFDKRLEKLKFHNEELIAAKKMQEKMGKFNVFDDDINSFEEENKRLVRKLRKLENYLETKIVHTEL